MATTEQPRVNKTAFVKNVLKEIGALGQTPPEGWRQQVEEALKKANLQMHTVTIYQIRSKAIKEAGKPANGRRGRPKATGATEATKGVRGRPKGTTKAKAKSQPITMGTKSTFLTIEDVISVQKFSENFGGLNGLAKVIGTIQGLVQSLK